MIRKFLNFFRSSEKYSTNCIEYSRTVSPVIGDICEPLFNYFEISMFTYCRIFNGGRRLYISTNHQWVENYIINGYQDDINHLSHYVPLDGVRYTLWEGFKKNRIFDAAHNQFNLGNGFSIYEKHDDYVDFFDFGADKNNNQIINLFINKIDLLMRFIEYFKEKSFFIIDLSNRNILVPKTLVSFDKIPRDENFSPKIVDSFKDYSRKGEIVRLRSESANLTRREIECLSLLYEGKSINQLSKNLNISPELAESYIQMAKMKSQTLTKEELIQFYKRDVIPLSENS